jgi:hypothetical protein
MKIWQRLLIIWGGISLAVLIVFVSYLAYALTLGNKASNDKATNSDVRFVLNWCELGDNRIEKVIKSYTSARSLTGDHLDAYSIKISHVDTSELSQIRNGVSRWYRCDTIPSILNDAISFTCNWPEEIQWFPKMEKLKSKEYYVYPVSIYCNGLHPSGAQLIFLNPNEKVIYFISTSK